MRLHDPATLLVCASLVMAITSCGHRTPVGPGGAPGSARAQVTGVTFRVTVPTWTSVTDSVFIAGDFQGWNPGSPAHRLTRQPDGRWSVSLALPAGQPIQFKFTRGSWTKVEKGPSGEEIANRTLTPDGVSTYDFTVARWADQPAPSTITGHVETFSYAPFLGGRRIWVYLPPGYAATAHRYPVLYMHDGQNLFDASTSFAGSEWRVDEACEDLIGSGQIAPLIVVGIDNGGSNRTSEYTPWPSAPYGGGGGDAYLTAIRDLLIPEIHRRYRTLVGSDFTYMAGSSLGELISAYAGYHYASTFRRVACVSPSLWWDNRHMIQDAAASGRPELARWYQDMGTAESSGSIDDLRAMRDVLHSQGFVSGVDLMSLEAQGAGHNESAWAARVPGLLRFLVGQPGTTGVP